MVDIYIYIHKTHKDYTGNGNVIKFNDLVGNAACMLFQCVGRCVQSVGHCGAIAGVTI